MQRWRDPPKVEDVKAVQRRIHTEQAATAGDQGFNSVV
jgi:hypothetical protein